MVLENCRCVRGLAGINMFSCEMSEYFPGLVWPSLATIGTSEPAGSDLDLLQFDGQSRNGQVHQKVGGYPPKIGVSIRKWAGPSETAPYCSIQLLLHLLVSEEEEEEEKSYISLTFS